MAIRGRYGYVFGADAFVVTIDLLAHGVVGHQRIGNDTSGEAGNRKFFQAVEEVPSIDFAVDELVIELDCFGWDCTSFFV